MPPTKGAPERPGPRPGARGRRQLLQPDPVIVIGGDVANAHEQLLAGVREVVYQRSLPLATRHLRLVPARLGDGAGVVGASVMVLERIFAPAAVDELVTGAAARRRRDLTPLGEGRTEGVTTPGRTPARPAQQREMEGTHMRFPRRRGRTTVALFAVLALALAACGGDEGGDTPDGGDATGSETAAAGPFTIGVSNGFTGSEWRTQSDRRHRGGLRRVQGPGARRRARHRERRRGRGRADRAGPQPRERRCRRHHHQPQLAGRAQRRLRGGRCRGRADLRRGPGRDQ